MQESIVKHPILLIIVPKHWRSETGHGTLPSFALTIHSAKESLSDVIHDVKEAAGFRRALFLTRVPKGTGRFLMRRLADLAYQ